MASVLDDKEKVKQALLEGDSLLEVIRKLELRPGGNTYTKLKNICKQEGIEIPNGWRHKTVQPSRRSLDDILVENSTYNRYNLKRRLIAADLLTEECNECGMGSEWNSKPLTLQIEHLNGIHDDNRLENLCLLCPNCHSQTETFAGRNARKRSKMTSFCLCGSKKTPTAKSCMKCRELPPPKTKIDWPHSSELIRWKTSGESYESIGRQLGVTGAAVKKRIKKFQRSYPSRYVLSFQLSG